MSVRLSQPVEDISETVNPDLFTCKDSLRYVSSQVVICVFIIGVLLTVGIALALDAPILLGLGMYAIIAGPICLAGIVSRVQQVRHATERTVTFQNGEITLRTSTDSESYQITECCWFHGKSTDDDQLTDQPIRRKTVNIVLPTGRTVACGFNDSLYSKWMQMLCQQNCREVLRQEGPLGVVYVLLVIMGLIGGGILGWYIGKELQQILIPQAILNQAANFVPAGLAIILAWLFATLPCFLPGWRRHTLLERQQLIQWAILFPAKAAIPVSAMLGGNLLTASLLAATFAGLFLAATRFLSRAPAISLNKTRAELRR